MRSKEVLLMSWYVPECPIDEDDVLEVDGQELVVAHVFELDGKVYVGALEDVPDDAPEDYEGAFGIWRWAGGTDLDPITDDEEYMAAMAEWKDHIDEDVALGASL